MVDRLNIEQNVVGKRVVRFHPIKKLDIFNMPVPVRVRRICEELGPTFIKMGQILSTRPDLIPVEFCSELERLQDKLPSFEYKKVEEQISSELSTTVSKAFNNFSTKPKAAASLSQVHLAELKNGEKVVVKVQRPDIKKMIFTDLAILYALAKLADKYIEESRPYDPVGVINEFKKSILREIDFTIEANNIDRFQRNFKDNNEVYIPHAVRDLSTEKVLTIAKVEGIKVTDIERIDKAGLDRKQIAINGANAILKQIFIDGFFHADLHPGNIFVLDGNKVAFIDFGMVGHIDEKTKAQLGTLLTAAVEQDVPEIIETFVELGATEEADFKKLNEDLTDFLGRYYGIPLKELKMERFLGDMMNIVAQDGIKIPPDLFLMAKTLITFEGVGRKLDCDFNMSIHAESFIERLMKQGYSPKKVAKEIRKFSKRLYNFTYSLPKDLTFILNKIKKGTLRAEFEHRGLENLINVFDKVSNRISFSVVIAALIIGSSVIMQTNKGPMLFGFPVLGVIGFVVAGIMGLWLAIAILRSGKL